MNNLILPAPAKVNLTLRVLGKRSDGFHEIETWMAPLIGLEDALLFRKADAFHFSCSDPEIPADESNLVVRAVRAYELATQKKCSHAIHLEKRIPHGAGLGGGSSDAASTLLGLNQLDGAPLSNVQLSEISSNLGSDVPFFLNGCAMICRGRGEILGQKLKLEAMSAILLKPLFSVATPDAYRRWQGSSNIPQIPYAAQMAHGIEWINDLERPVFQKHRFLAEMKRWLLDRGEVRVAMMTGSGSTMMAILTDPSHASTVMDAAHRELDPTLWAQPVTIAAQKTDTQKTGP